MRAEIFSYLCAFAIVLLCSTVVAADVVKIDCQRPPQLVDPATCCQDGGRDRNAENCAQRMGFTGRANNSPPTVETATCLAECILSESQYMPQPAQLNFETIQADLTKKFANDSVYVETMVAAFRKCEPHVQRKLLAFQQLLPTAQLAQGQGQGQRQDQGQGRGCSPFAGMLLGCAYMEYFKNCPVHRWTDNPQCALAKQFVKQCALGA